MSYSSSYIGKNCRHFKTKIEEHINKDNSSRFIVLNIYTPPQHLLTRAQFSLSFKIIDRANSKFNLKIKEDLRINCTRPNSNVQQNYLALTVSL